MGMGVGWGWGRATTGGVLGYPISRLGYPVVPLRLYFGLIFLSPFFTFLAIMAHIRFGWFTFHRQLYSILGLAAGVFGGYAEAFFVTKRLRREVEVVAWFLIPLGLVVWLPPIAYVYLVLGVGEFLPFATYFLLPSFAIAAVTSGFVFRRFEKREKARVFAFFMGGYVPYPKYWIETPETLEIELHGFLEAVADKNASWMLYYGRYAKQLKKLVEELSERSDKVGKRISEIRELTTHLLDENMKFYRKGIKITLIFAAGCVLWLALMFFAAANNYFYIPQKYGNQVSLITFGLPFLLIFAYVFIKRKALTRDYEETVQTIMKKADPKTQNTIKDLLRLMANE
jgi:hypothetical protein